MPYPGLAIDLGGSLDRRFRLDDLGAAYLDELLRLDAPRDRREENLRPLRLTDLCVLTVELSGAGADV